MKTTVVSCDLCYQAHRPIKPVGDTGVDLCDECARGRMGGAGELRDAIERKAEDRRRVGSEVGRLLAKAARL